jgi:hypothetical protein
VILYSFRSSHTSLFGRSFKSLVLWPMLCSECESLVIWPMLCSEYFTTIVFTRGSGNSRLLVIIDGSSPPLLGRSDDSHLGFFTTEKMRLQISIPSGCLDTRVLIVDEMQQTLAATESCGSSARALCRYLEVEFLRYRSSKGRGGSLLRQSPTRK